MIKINGLNKYYNKGKRNQIHVINNTTLSLPDKGLISFLGQSGSGKTTLLNCIGGLDRAKGEVVYDDVVINGYDVRKIDKYRQNNIGYIFQNYNLIPTKTVYENLRIALEIVGVYEKSEIDKRIEYTLKAVGMFKYRKKQAQALSGGQQQRVCIARSLVKNSKIIIADEPTGNLDSENTIEVMNILKKISKNTLVLLVTHNKEIAKFYSDQIIEIKDGQVQKQYDCQNETSLQVAFNNNLYLKDMYHTASTSPLGNINIYSDSPDSESLDIEVYIKNNNIYIKTSKGVRLFEDSSLKIINDHYTEIKKEELENNDFDTSWYSSPHKKTFRFRRLWSNILNSFKKFRSSNHLSKLLNCAFVFMGALLSLSIICMINFSSPDDTDFIYIDGYNIMYSPEHVYESDPIDKLCENYTNGAISEMTVYRTDTQLLWSHHYAFNKKINVSLNVLVARFTKDMESSLMCGSIPINDNELLIDTTTAKDICQEYGNGAKIEDLLNKEVSLNYLSSYQSCVICGIVNNSQRAVFGTERFYTSWAASKFVDYFGDVRYYEYEQLNGEPFYEIVSGRDVKPFDEVREREILVHDDSEVMYDEYLDVKGYRYKVVGRFRYKEGIYDVKVNEYIQNFKPREVYDAFENIAVNSDEYVILEGREPNKIDECMVSIYSDKKIGEEYFGRKIVGIYNGNKKALSAFCVVDINTYILSNYEYSEICFKVNSKDLTLYDKQEVFSIYDSIAKKEQEDQASNLELFKILSFVLLAFSVVFTYLVMRSRMLQDIYTIGVYRSIGATKSKIIKDFMVDLFITTTCTTLVGYVLILFLYNISADSLNYIFDERIFKINNLYFSFGLLVVYFINIVFGLLPIILLLKKTPAEICNKYDL